MSGATIASPKDPLPTPDDLEVLRQAELAFFADHEADPSGRAAPYHRTLAAWQTRLDPTASLELQLAARAQHLGRHRRPRSDFPDGRAGYHQWRTAALLASAEQANARLQTLGLSSSSRERVSELIQKRGLGRDAEANLLEDAVCLTFLERDFARFAAGHPDNKVIDIVHKTLKKMTTRGHQHALELAAKLDTRCQKLVAEAVGRLGSAGLAD